MPVSRKLFPTTTASPEKVWLGSCGTFSDISQEWIWSLVSPVEESGAVLSKQNAIERGYIAISRVDIDIHIYLGKKRLRRVLKATSPGNGHETCLGAYLKNIYGKERESAITARQWVVFFSSGINFSPCVPSFQFLGGKETDITMQMSLCSASGYELKNYKLDNAEL